MTDRPLVALDLDGVIADFPETLIRVFNQRHAGALGALDVEDWTKYRIEDQYAPEVAARLDGIIREPGFFASLSPYPDARKSLMALLAFADVEICTMPPLTTLPWGRKVTDAHSAGDKVGWVVRNFPEVAADVTITHKKDRLRADALVDDSAKNIVKWCKAHPEGLGYLVARPWNHGAELPANARRGPLAMAADVLSRWFASRKRKPRRKKAAPKHKPGAARPRARKAQAR